MREKQEDIWIAHTDLPSAPGHPFYQRLNELLEGEKFDEFVEGRCAKFYAAKYGRPSLSLGIYLRSLLLGYLRVSIVNAGLPGNWRTRWDCGALWGLDWRKKRMPNKEWESPADGDAWITKMKDGRTHLARKAEHAVDLDTGAVVAVTLQGADLGDTVTLDATLSEAGMAVAELVKREAAEQRPEDTPQVNVEGIEEMVGEIPVTH
jgi:hypothetical protein